MLSKLLRFLILPILLIILLVYASIPWWVPVVAKYSQPYTGLDIKHLEVGYPWHDHWQIQHLQGHKEASDHLTKVRLENIELNYHLLDLWYGSLPTVSIGKVHFDSQLAQTSLDSVPILLLLPQRWLYQMPESLNIERISGKISTLNTVLGQSFTLAGKFNANPDHAHAIAKITTEDNRDLFFEAELSNNNEIGATLFNKQQSAPIAKLTSQMRRTGNGLNWQGQMALNLPVMQKLLANFIPNQFALPVEQGRLISNWQINVPSDQQQSLPQWLQAAQGEHQFQVQVQTNTKLAKDIRLDANLTHIMDGSEPDQWQVNAGSQLSLKPDWRYFNLQEHTIDSMSLHGMEVRMTAQGPVGLELAPDTDNLLGSQQALLLDGVINATLQSPASQYQIFTQLKNLSYSNTNSWHGQADLSGYYVLPQQHPLLKQVPLGIQQVQALAKLQFNMSPSTWQIKLAPNSKLSANQVESQQRQSQVLLFANDRLNLSNAEPLELTYYTANDEWQWNDINLSLRPQTATGTSQANSGALGLQIQLPAGRSQFNNRPSQGFYQLHARDTRLRGWPEFDLLGEGMVTFGNNQVTLDFAGQAQPFAPALKGQFEWNLIQQQGQLNAAATGIDLLTLQNKHQVKWPLQVSAGNIDYSGQWQWQEDTKQSQHQFQLHNVDGSSERLSVNDLSGQVDVQPHNDSLDTSYQLQAQMLQPKPYLPALGIKQVELKLNTSSPLRKGLAKAMATPESGALQALKGQFLGGTLEYQTDMWKLHDISLAQVSQVLWPDMDAEGSLSGSMVLTEDWLIEQLQVQTNEGANLQLRQPLAEAQPGADTFNQLLKNMQVAELEIQSQAPQVGSKLPLSVRLQGRSEDFSAGQPVDLNLTVEADLGNLLAP